MSAICDDDKAAQVRFLCDEMLRRLGRWLRAAGYDTVIAEGGAPDRTLAARSVTEARVLLTKDRHLAAEAGRITRVVLVPGEGIDQTARAMRSTLDIDWQYAPFTRCLIDNALLRPAPRDFAKRVPPASRAVGDPLRVCPDCGRLYWPGGHVRRMQMRLMAWQHRDAPAARTTA